MAYAPPTYLYPIEVPTWGYEEAPAAAWTPTIDPSALHTVMHDAPFTADAAAEPEYQAAALEASSSSSSSSPSSPDGTPTNRSPRSSWGGVSPSTNAPALAANNAHLMESLMQMIAWPANGARPVHPKKRIRPEYEYSKEKHLQTEKRRREDMSEAIDMIHRIMPECRMDKKLTKVDILQDAALYFAKLQAVALRLVEENAELKARVAAANAAANAAPSQY